MIINSADDQFGAVLSTTVNANPGSLEVELDFQGDDAPSGSYSARVGVARLNNLATEYNNFIGELGDEFGGSRLSRAALSQQLPFNIPSSRSAVIPDGLDRLRDGLTEVGSFRLQPATPQFADNQGGFFDRVRDVGVPVGGMPVDRTFTESASWQPIPIPRAPQLGIEPPSLPDFTVVAEVRRTEFTQPTRTWRTEIEVPSNILFDVREVSGSGNCLGAFPEIERGIDELASRVSAPRSSIRSADTTISRVKDTIEQADQNARSALSADIGEIVAAVGQNQVENLRNEVSQVRISTGDLRDLEGRYQELRSRIQNTGACAEELLNELEDRVGEIPDLLDRAGRLESEASRLRDLLGATGQVRCRVQFEAIAREVRRVEDDAGLGSDRVPTTFDRLEDAVSRVRSVRDDIQANIPSDSRCRNEFEARLDRAESRFRRRLTDPTASGLDCEDVDQGIRTIVSNFEDRSREFTAQPFEDRRPAERAELLSDQTRVINTIRTNVDDLNPCKSQLLNRVRTAVSQVQGADAISEFQLDCTDRFEGVARELDSFEEEVLSLDAPVGPEEFQQVTEDGNRIIDLIEQSTEPETECREEFVERTRALVDRAERLGARVRITTDGQSESQERREQLLGDILGSLERLERQRERTEVEVDSDSGGAFLT